MGAEIVQINYSSPVIPGEPFDIDITIKNNGTKDHLFGELLIINGEDISIYYFEETIDENSEYTHTITIDGIIEQTRFKFNAGRVFGECSDFLIEIECINAGCYWYENSCHNNPDIEICTWITDKGGPDALNITDVFEIIDSYLFEIPPIGYSFIPEIIEIMGIIDYFLGNISDGNDKTGCEF